MLFRNIKFGEFRTDPVVYICKHTIKHLEIKKMSLFRTFPMMKQLKIFKIGTYHEQSFERNCFPNLKLLAIQDSNSFRNILNTHEKLHNERLELTHLDDDYIKEIKKGIQKFDRLCDLKISRCQKLLRKDFLELFKNLTVLRVEYTYFTIIHTGIIQLEKIQSLVLFRSDLNTYDINLECVDFGSVKRLSIYDLYRYYELNMNKVFSTNLEMITIVIKETKKKDRRKNRKSQWMTITFNENSQFIEGYFMICCGEVKLSTNLLNVLKKDLKLYLRL